MKYVEAHKTGWDKHLQVPGTFEYVPDSQDLSINT